jgi:hypothetical protein
MSEYQCYEFVALDRPLTLKEMSALRAISSRAEITPTRFWNEYHWGDLKADPAKLVERYFDAHLYFANWGTHRLMLRLPNGRVDARALRPYMRGHGVTARAAGNHVVIDLVSEDDDRLDEDEGPGSLAAMLPLREELMRGDRRAAYIAWLLAVQQGDVADDACEPPVPPGLRNLTAPQVALVEFLRIDENLLAAAAVASAHDKDDSPDLRAWVLALPARAKDRWLARAVQEPTLALGTELRHEFRKKSKPAESAGRLVADLRQAAEARRPRARPRREPR